MKIRKLINATIVALFLFVTLFIPLLITNQINVNAEDDNVYRFTEVRNPGFWIWEDPNRPNYYAYDTAMLTGTLQRFHFHKDQYGDEHAFVRIGHAKPTHHPTLGKPINQANLRLVEVRPYGHDAFFPSDVTVDHSDTRVLIKIDGVDFTRTPHVDVYNEHKKGTWDSGTEIYSENHHIPLELVWEYTDEEHKPKTITCPPSGVQTSVTEESGRIYYSCNCDENGCDVCVDIYYETTQMEVIGPTPEKVQAGQGAEFIVKTEYKNDYPYHEGEPYAASEVEITGEISDDYPNTTIQTVAMLPDVDDPAYEWEDNGGLEVEWKLPYAMFDKDGNWTMTDSESEVQNHLAASPYNFGGYQRWYFGFDVPDNEEFEFTFQTNSHGYNNITLCDKRTVTIEGTPYDDFIVRTVDPNNPFPAGVGVNWQGNEHLITDLKDWYNSTQESDVLINSHSIFQTIKNKLKDMFD
ncbi:hypothetical protein [Calidifontibacillus erzurumensis]|uniref:hypothetical protein n=1 Tax=Calidifontibacillus erzurumensis TaxID=2741433 RepID=UPI0035B54563